MLMYLRTDVCIMYVCIYVCMYVNIYVCRYVRIYVCIYIYIYTYNVCILLGISFRSHVVETKVRNNSAIYA